MKKEEKSKKDSKSQSEWVDLNNFPPKNQRIIVFDIENNGSIQTSSYAHY